MLYLSDVNMGSMTGTLQQLGYLAAYSSEMFQELLTLTDEVFILCPSAARFLYDPRIYCYCYAFHA